MKLCGRLIDGGRDWQANRCFLAAEFPPKRRDDRALIGRGRWGRSLSRWGHFSRDFVRNPSCRRYNRGVCFHLGSAGSTRGMTQRFGGPLWRSCQRVRTGTHQHTLMGRPVGFGRTATVADGGLPLFGGPRRGGASWRTKMADLVGGPRWRTLLAVSPVAAQVGAKTHQRSPMRRAAGFRWGGVGTGSGRSEVGAL